MKTALSLQENTVNFRLGLPALLLALMVPLAVWLVAHAAQPSAGDDDRHAEFVRSSAAIEARVRQLGELERSMLSSAAAPGKATYYRQRRDAARHSIDALSRSAAALAESADEHARVEQLTALVRVADARYDKILASAGRHANAPRLANADQ
jgi:hypothetical protein